MLYLFLDLATYCDTRAMQTGFQCLGIWFANRQISKLITSWGISRDGDTWTINIQASLRHAVFEYNIGEMGWD